ncbi:MAG: hypothetical protein LBR91_00865, partial [Puniceicoccales bacterium]|nr:hypothetical protein [Puniceicoccales bacterium]
EKFWAKLKRKLRDILPLFSSLGDALYHAFFVPFLTGAAIHPLPTPSSMLFSSKMTIYVAVDDFFSRKSRSVA